MSATLLLDGQEFYYITYILHTVFNTVFAMNTDHEEEGHFFFCFFTYIPTTTFLESSGGILSTLRNN